MNCSLLPMFTIHCSLRRSRYLLLEEIMIQMSEYIVNKWIKISNIIWEKCIKKYKKRIIGIVLVVICVMIILEM